MHERIKTDREESDTSLFLALMYYGEMVLKLITSVLVACIDQNRERDRYRFIHRLVRADGIGEWVEVLDEMINGPVSFYSDPLSSEERLYLSKKFGSGNLPYEALTLLHKCMNFLEIPFDKRKGKVNCLRWFVDFATFRNKTRAHGAKKPGQYSLICNYLKDSIDLIIEHTPIFNYPWAFLHRNLSGKYRITMIGGDSKPYEYLKKTRDLNYPDGIYIFFNDLRYVELILSDSDASDFFLPNGGFTEKKHEYISYISGATKSVDSSRYLMPSNELPKSETHGLGKLDIQGNCFGNIPPLESGYILRNTLEQMLMNQLLEINRHPIITLTGPGGIGKTSLALKVINDMMNSDNCPYTYTIWFSARDIDLLSSGPKYVKPRGISRKDFALEYAYLIEETDQFKRTFDAEEYFSNKLACPKGSEYTLFVFDNFETVLRPAELFKWLDTYIRTPNKILITTRIRGVFKADYPINVGGMEDDECNKLMDKTSSFLGIKDIITRKYRDELISESGGHPYVIKILLGEVKKANKLCKIERIIADQDEILRALFERTYERLSPASQWIFLTLANWKSLVPQIAIEAVFLDPKYERINIKESLDELIYSSFIQEIKSPRDDVCFINVPLASRMFAKKQLEISQWLSLVEDASKALQVFGATQKPSVEKKGIEPSIQRLFKGAADSISTGQCIFDDVRQTLEYIAKEHDDAWIMLVELIDECVVENKISKTKNYIEKYLSIETDPNKKHKAWFMLANMYEKHNMYSLEIDTLIKMSMVQECPIEYVSNNANRINNIIKNKLKNKVTKTEKTNLIAGMIKVIEKRKDEFDATTCSRFAWILLQLNKKEEALELAKKGKSIDKNNEHCNNLIERLSY